MSLIVRHPTGYALRCEQSGWHIGDDSFKYIFLIEYLNSFIGISCKWSYWQHVSIGLNKHLGHYENGIRTMKPHNIFQCGEPLRIFAVNNVFPYAPNQKYCTEMNVWQRRLNSSFKILILTLIVRGPSYLGFTRSISWLLMLWLLTSPGHQQPWYQICRIGWSLSYLRNDFKYLRGINVEKYKM